MSSTNRGAERRVDDAYMTPGWCASRLLDVWQPRGRLLVEPFAGDGAIVRKIMGEWVTYEIRDVKPPSQRHNCCDFLTVREIDVNVCAVVTNPPFSLAEEGIRHSRYLYPDADLVFLLRLNFLGSSGRLPLWRDLGAPDVFVLPNRPSFTGGKTDSCEYAWFVWPPSKRDFGRIRVLAETPRYER